MRSTNNVLLAIAAAISIGAAGCTTTSADNNARSAGTTIDDAAITASVKTKLIGDPDTKAYQINVETSNGVVQLNGFVDSSTARTEAQQIAAGTDGVRRVENNLEVRSSDRSAGTVIDDATLTAKVDAALAADTRTSALRLNVATRDGEVHLSGFAKSAAEKDAASQIARKVDGVRTVSNDIDVR